MSKYKIAVGMITGDYKTHLGLLTSFIEFSNTQESNAYEFTPIFHRGLYLDQVRNSVAGEFVLRTDCDFLWFLDSDNGFKTDALRFFMEDFSRPDVHIVAGKYYFKNRDNVMVAGFTHDSCQPGFYKWFPEGSFSQDLINISQMGTAMVGTGCMMIRRDVFEQTSFPWFQTPWRQYDGNAWSMTGEDTYFCEEVQKAGFDIYLDQRIESPHYAGAKCYPEEWDQFNLEP